MSLDLWETLKSAWPIVAGFVGLVLVGGAITAYHSGKSSGITDQQHSDRVQEAIFDHIKNSSDYKKYSSESSELTEEQKKDEETKLKQMIYYIVHKDPFGDKFNIQEISKESTTEEVKAQVAKMINPQLIDRAIKRTKL